ncbi:MAG: hypothetical protein AB8H79_13335 [Myxococcota bacterium]
MSGTRFTTIMECRRVWVTLCCWVAVFLGLGVVGVTPAQAGGETIAVVAEADEGPLPLATLNSVLWHALYAKHKHRAVFYPDLNAAAVEQMRDSSLTTLLHVRLSWRPDSARVKRDDGETYLVGGHYPVIETTEYRLHGDMLIADTTWRTDGPLSVFHVRGAEANRFISLPEVSLQETASLAVQPIRAPLWKTHIDLVRVPVVLAADDDYRSFYGVDQWPQVAGRAVARANAILADVGVELEVVSTQEWHSPDRLHDLSSLLGHLSKQPIGHPNALRIGFTGQTQLGITWQSEMEDVGRAYLPGRDVLVADQAVAPGHDPAWDVAEEGVTVAHEALHALGIPHSEQPDHLMSATKRGSVHAVSPATRELGRAAAASRYTHWNSTTALTTLSQAAEAHLTDPELQIDYIGKNLHYGVGMPDPNSVQPGQLSALTNVAVGRYYLARAAEDPGNAKALRNTARRHAESALETKPQWQEARQLQRQLLAAERAQRAIKTPKIAPADEYHSTGFGDRPTCPSDGSATCE